MNDKIADVVPITSVPAEKFGIFKAKDGSTIRIVQKDGRVKFRVQSVSMDGNDFRDVVLYLDFDADTALAIQVATGMAAIGAKGHDLIDAPKGMEA